MTILVESSVKVVEDASYVSPPPGSVPTASLPLTCFDRVFFCFPLTWMRSLFFYEFKHPTSYFMQTILPNLKTSLSLTLQHFFPFAANLVYPPPPQVPYIAYTQGDSVSFVVKVSTADFNHLVGDHARDNQELPALVPKRPSSNETNGCKQEPVMAIQVTVFPNVGFSIGVGFSHVVADGRSFGHFMKSWASIHRCEGDLACLDNYLPCFNRDLINDPVELASLFTKGAERAFQSAISPSILFNNFRVTYKIKDSQVELLKDRVKTKCMEVNGSEPIRISTFAVTCAYMWVCLLKLQQSGTHQHLSSTDSDALSYFHFAAECRDHLKLPQTYFGNCIILRLASAKKSEVLGENGILVAATAIGREIMEFQKQPFKDAQESLLKIIEIFKMEEDLVRVGSSPKFESYKTDFGWGRPRNIENPILPSFGTCSMFVIAENREEEEGGVEFALAFASHDLDIFNTIFHQGLLKLESSK
ncbi:hypothetical protein Golax_003215 [Gossypium laxum]|uniref:Uncharacterized protein n=1 Tax=Gossypium laxum TaxID=34288 RepID=A0A7J9AF82_9ROSI|nr:hypothetical protein [Gossypium laxum]